jgi:hypothetical protein
MGDIDIRNLHENIIHLSNYLKESLESLNAREIIKSINDLKMAMDAIEKSFERNTEQIKKNESAVLKQFIEKIDKENKERIKINRLIIKWLIPGISVLTLVLFLITYLVLDKSKELIVYFFGILGIYALSIIGLIVALAIINKRED